MKKLIYKLFAVSVIVLVLPFILTLILSSNKKANKSLEAMNFTIYYDKNGSKQKLDFDQYLIGVVAANMPTGYHLEALKAQAVISRTYALYNMSLLSEENPLKSDFSTSELGLSYIDPKDMEQYWDNDNYIMYFTKLENSVYATKEQVLTYKDDLILPVFFGNGTGYTRNSKEAWGVDIPYLVSVPSKKDVTSIHYLRITEYDVSVLLGLLKQAYPSIDLNEKTFFQELIVTNRDSVGYVTEIDLGTLSVSGEEFTKVLGLSSNHFYIEDYEGKARVICTGVGHGVGLSQYGSNTMAEDGYSYDDILTHYYTGAKIINLD